MLLGSGIIGGIGLGLGYISPVSTLIKWFPDKRGMATGMAIMGFGGGAMIGSPLAAELMKHFATPTSVGVWETFAVMGCLYIVAMLSAPSVTACPPPAGSPRLDAARPGPDQGHDHPRPCAREEDLGHSAVLAGLDGADDERLGRHRRDRHGQPDAAGGLRRQPHRVPAKFGELDKTQLTAIAGVAAGFAALLSLFNIAGRFFWASLSDKLGRKLTYTVFFILGGLLYFSIPASAGAGNKLLFVGAFCIILSMYGGGFATVPAYLADLFGTQMVGAIHGRLLTAWATAGILGPVVVNYMRDYQLGLGIPRDQVYNQTMYILVGMLVIGLICNWLVRPVADKHFMTEAELAEEKRLAHDKAQASAAGPVTMTFHRTPVVWVALAWLAVGVPLAWGSTVRC
jgi:MFS family permease